MSFIPSCSVTLMLRLNEITIPKEVLKIKLKGR
jgi:hypothetical protein